MNRQTRTIVVLFVAVVMASIASFGVYGAIQRIPVREVEVASYHVVVAAQPLPTGTRVAPEHLKVVAWPSANRVPGGFTNAEDVVNRGLVASVVVNEPITENKLAPIEAGAGLPPTIPPGMRAMSVKVNEVIGVAGFVTPGTRVDVVVVIRQQQNNSMSRTVVSNAQVLTAGTRYDQEKARDGEPIPSTVVTLLVSPEDGERIALAQNEGQIVLALRNPLDTLPTETPGIRSASLMGGAAPAPTPRPSQPRRAIAESPAPAPAPAPRPYTVEAIRAAKRTEETIR
jgi:pilus assembly protein CpaB